MISHSMQALVLAAGKSSRFNTENIKLSYDICGREIIAYPIAVLKDLGLPITVIVGYQKDKIINICLKNNFKNLEFIEQKEQLGTGHALQVALPILFSEHILVINGDMPLINQNIINDLIQKHIQSNATVSFITSHNSDPSIEGYARVVKQDNKITIIESIDFKGDPATHCCINAGVYTFKRSFLNEALLKLQKQRNTGEIYITDLIKFASQNNEIVETIEVPFDKIRGVNTLKELWIAEQIKRTEIIDYWMANGVRFTSPQTTHVDYNVTIENNTIIGAGVHLRNNTSIGSYCSIDAFSIIDNALIKDHVTIYPYTLISDSIIQTSAKVGPFAHIKNQSIIFEQSVIGNFVEITQSSIGSSSKAKHLTYLGNAIIGSNVNIGAGTITCNYDSISKNTTIIKNQAFIASNNSIVAPVTIGENSYTAAGSIITEDVPPNSLAIARPKQINKKEYVKKLKQKLEKRKNEVGNFTIKESKFKVKETG